MDVGTESATRVRYPNGIIVSETTAERYFMNGPCDLREAFSAGGAAQARHWQEEVPTEHRALVNAVRSAACRPGASLRSPESILTEMLDLFADRTLVAWAV